MQIDWVIVVAQLVNFLVLVWLLQRFLYRPVLDAIAARQDRIKQQIAAAEAMEDEARSVRETYEARLAEIADERDEMLAQARRDAERMRTELADEARRDADETAQEWRAEIAREQSAIAATMRTAVAEAALSVARRTLGDLADVDFESRLVDRLVAEVEALDPGRVEMVHTLMRDTGAPVEVVSGQRLRKADRERIEAAMRTLLPGADEIRFRTTSKTNGTVTLSLPGLHLSWGIEPYLDAVAETLNRQLQEAAAPPGRQAAE